MRDVFSAIQNNEKLPDFVLDFSVSMGLTPLHYALILRQDKAMKQLLSKKEWMPAFTEQDAELKEVYGYINLAKFVDSAVIAYVIGAADDVIKINQNAKKQSRKKAQDGTQPV